MADVAQVQLPVPYEGLDLSVPPHELPPTRAWRLHNWLVHEERRLPLRGPVRWLDRYTESGSPVAAYPYRRKVAVPVVTSVDAWPWRRFDGLYGDPVMGTGLVFDTQSNAWQEFPTAGQFKGGPHYADYQNYIWFGGLQDATGGIQHLGQTHPINYIERLDPTTSTTLGGLGLIGPYAPQGVANYAERLFVLGGTAPGEAEPHTLRPHSLWYTNPDQDPFVLGSWKTSNVANQIVVGQESPNDYGLALASLGSALVVFKRRSVWQLTGTGSETFSVRDVSRTDGLTDPRAVQVVDSAVYYVSPRGLTRFDGAEQTLLSDAVAPELLPLLRAYGAPDSPGDSFVRLDRLYRSYLLLSVGQGDATAWAALYHVPTGRWAGYTAQTHLAAAVVDDRTVAFAPGVDALDLTYVTAPDLAVSRSVPLGRDTGNNQVPTEFAADAWLPPLRGASPLYRTWIKRAGIEYAWQRTTAEDSGGTPQVTLQRYGTSDGDGQAGPTLGPVAGRQVTASDQRPQLAWQDSGAEATDAHLAVERDDGVGEQLVRAELLGFAAEVQSPTHQR